MHDAIREASDIVDKTHRPTSVFQTNSVNSSAIWSELHSASPVLSKYYNECNETKIHFVRSFPVASVAGQRAVFKAMSDGCHYERVLQKKVAAEVMRQLWLIDRS
ncbi:Hypothetical protein, putative [Bodo saltans]|uniref:Uncharacterized protein n=1 Tax=Bodo saltans TaxID=75058 RepID=A0A0S4IR17_BODSA|nr:Hypothetical protein, putative [Bodo saltans]|eukprot:CUF33424.1 Hypothetical protein, putative [Bodo saltans]